MRVYRVSFVDYYGNHVLTQAVSVAWTTSQISSLFTCSCLRRFMAKSMGVMEYNYRIRDLRLKMT